MSVSSTSSTSSKTSKRSVKGVAKNTIRPSAPRVRTLQKTNSGPRKKVRDNPRKKTHTKSSRRRHSNQKVTIAFGKFVEFVQIRHHYYVISAIVEHKTNTVRFIECKTPLRQKSFFVYINPDYIMKAPEEKYVKMRVRYLPDETPSKRRGEFLLSMKGKNIKGDLLFIASDMIYMSMDDNLVRCFSVVGEEGSDVEEEPSQVVKVKKSLKSIMGRLGISSKTSVPDEELEFEDEDGEPYDKTKSIMNATTGTIVDIVIPEDAPVEEIVQPPIKPLEDPLEPVEDIVTEEDLNTEDIVTEGDEPVTEEPVTEGDNPVTEGDEPVTEGDISVTEEPVDEHVEDLDEDLDEDSDEDTSSSDLDEGSDYDNELPDIEREAVVLGMVFILTDIRVFFTKIESFENELIEYHMLLDENENSMRHGRLEDISRIASDLASRSKECITNLIQKEADVKASVASMSAMILRIGAIKDSIEKNPTKYRSDIISEVEELSKLYASSREEVNRYNIRLLKIRDTIDDMLYNFLTHLEDAEMVCRKYDYVGDD